MESRAEIGTPFTPQPDAGRRGACMPQSSGSRRSIDVAGPFDC